MLPEFKRACSMTPRPPTLGPTWQSRTRRKTASKSEILFPARNRRRSFQPCHSLPSANFAFETGDKTETMRDLFVVLKNPELSSYYQPASLPIAVLVLHPMSFWTKACHLLPPQPNPSCSIGLPIKTLPEAEATWDWMVKHSLTNRKVRSRLRYLPLSNDASCSRGRMAPRPSENRYLLSSSELGFQRRL